MIKCDMNFENIKKYIDLHKEKKIAYTLTISNYSTRIVSNLINIHFIKNQQSNAVFSAFNKIKKDVVLKEKPYFNIEELKYYDHNFKGAIYSDLIYMFDIKSAYATILKNEGYLSKSTYEYVCNLKKKDRLVCLGMLASKKTIFTIDENGLIIKQEKKISDLANYFFYAAKRTSEIINGCKYILGDAFLFSWVDAIYFLYPLEWAKIDNKIIIEHYFKNLGLNTTFEVLKEFEIIENEKHFNCSYKKNDLKKVINIPKKETLLQKKIFNYLANRIN